MDDGIGQLNILKELRGVVKVFYLDQEILRKIKEEEATVKATGDIAVQNKGFEEALKRKRIACIVKNTRFRLPPEPTVVLLSTDGKLMGVEVFPQTAKEYQDREDVVWLSDGFVVFTDIVPGEGENEVFVMPPVSFPELNESNGCANVVSCSPAPTCDKMIREYAGMEDDPRLASILVAFDPI
ncbi:MAG: hypothetical protein PHI62_02055 [Candidatus Methanomethylophilaceae archaeon]|nr:hypothetical protein [Candidatus Methanomethylophilaceae archaeon]